MGKRGRGTLPARHRAQPFGRHPFAAWLRADRGTLPRCIPTHVLAVIAVADNLFALDEFDALLREELVDASAFAASRPAGRALAIQACAANRELPVDLRHPHTLRLHVERELLAGDVACSPEALPFEDEMFQFVLVQHAGDVLGDCDDLARECARVLLPGGLLLWYGLNRWSPWVAWLRWRSRGIHASHAVTAESMRRRLLRSGLAAGTPTHVGKCWPGPARVQRTERDGLAAPMRGAWSIVATKRREVLTPLRPIHRRRIAISPSLAAPSRRASA